MGTTAMVKSACNADRQPSYARVVMTLEDCISEYEDYQKRKAACARGD